MYSNVWAMRWTCTLITIEANLWCCAFYFAYTNCTLGVCSLAISRWKQFLTGSKGCCQCYPEMSISSFMVPILHFSFSRKSWIKRAWCFYDSHWIAFLLVVPIFFLNDETFVNSKMLIKCWAAILVLVITFLHSVILALIHGSEKLQYGHMQI